MTAVILVCAAAAVFGMAVGFVLGVHVVVNDEEREQR
jgi:membrane associated rhomboid family serine protease